MRTFDLSPLYRSTVGFDRMGSLLEKLAQGDVEPGYPPYNIERTGENAYRISMAVAGFSQGDLGVETRQNLLTISGCIKQAQRGAAENYLYQGIAARNFERRFQLADHVRVAGANLEDGLLHVDLVRHIPEEMKPRRVEIGCCAPREDTSGVIESKTEEAA